MSFLLLDDPNAVRIEYIKDQNEADKFLMSRNVAYKSEDALLFRWDFTDWCSQNLKGNWHYLETNDKIYLYFEHPSDAVFFRLGWMTDDRPRRF